MAGTPQLKIYNAQNEYIGCLKHAEDAACLVGLLGDGASIRVGHSKRDTVWVEGKEDQSANESYDYVAQVIAARKGS